MPALLAILRLPAVLGLLLAVLVCSGCGQPTARQSAPEHAPTVAQVAVEQHAEVIVEPPRAEPVVEQPATASSPLLFADERPEPYRPRGPPGLCVLPFFPAPLILPADLAMPGEVGVVVDRAVRGQQVVAWAAISPVGWRAGAVRAVGFRYYNPVTGRYLNRDPLGYADGMNVYLYVKNNPINRIDPLGLADGLFGIWLDGVGETFGGMVDSVVDTAKAGYQAVTSPVQTVKGLAHAVTHPVETVKAMGADIAEKAGTDRGRGNLVGTLVQTALGAGVAKKGLDVLKKAPEPKHTPEPPKTTPEPPKPEPNGTSSATGDGPELKLVEPELELVDPPLMEMPKVREMIENGRNVKEVPIDKIDPPRGGRDHYSPDKLQSQGPFDPALFTPPYVLPKPGGRFEFMNGMTRTENARRAGHQTIPVEIGPEGRK